MLAVLILKHLVDIGSDLKEWRYSWDISPVSQLLYSLVIAWLAEMEVAVNKFLISNDEVQLNKDLIWASMDFQQHWQEWLNTSATDLTFPVRNLHAYLLRYTKGCVKYWRVYRSDILK